MALMIKYIRKGPFQDVEETEAWQAQYERRLGAMGDDAIVSPAPAPAE
jgi:cytochrome d ubiquinol oxidase subunit I